MTDDTLQNQLDAAHDRVADLESAVSNRDCQGVAPGARVPAVRVSSLMAVVERFEKGQSS